MQEGNVEPTDVQDQTETATGIIVAGDDAVADELIEEELLVEEISIDGMCGVY